jgi:hypothetical protein
MPSSDDEYAAVFTSINQQKPVVCERVECPTKNFPPGTDMRYLHSTDPTKSGRSVCAGCYSYYRQKTTTVRRGMDISKVMNNYLENDLFYVRHHGRHKP